jgi:hypothetical protein
VVLRKTKTKGEKNMKKILCLVLVAAFACLLPAAEIGGKFAFGFEQGVGVGDSTLGRGVSFKLCLSNNVAVKGVVGFNYSDKINDIHNPDPTQTGLLYKEDKPRVDFTAAAYGILVFRRFEKVHLNGMTGLVITVKDNHFKTTSGRQSAFFDTAVAQLNEPTKRTDLHLRILMAPEIFIFPNFSLEYKYGFDVSLKKEEMKFNVATSGAPDYRIENPNRLHIDVIGDLNLLQSASVHFYF